jgi:hypothetical protein
MLRSPVPSAISSVSGGHFLMLRATSTIFGEGWMAAKNHARLATTGPLARRAPEDERDPPPERIETAQLRQSPDFIIIGTQRGGTTSLYRYLTAHPEIGQAFRKEVHFFDRYFDRGIDWYLAHFPLRGEFPVVGEASPYYLFHPEAPARILAAVPQAKFIVLLRNPVDRAYSQYHMKLERELETLSFEEALEREPERLALSEDPLDPAWRHHSYLARGVYVDQVRRWFDRFPRDRFLIIKSEDFYAEPLRILHQTQEFLGVRSHDPATLKVYHQADYVVMNPITRRRLADHFAPYNRQLYDLLGRDFGWEDD